MKDTYQCSFIIENDGITGYRKTNEVESTTETFGDKIVSEGVQIVRHSETEPGRMIARQMNACREVLSQGPV